MTEEDFEAEWQGRQRQAEEALQRAAALYAQAPLGMWRTSVGRNPLLAERVIWFKPEGQGRYRAYRRSEGRRVIEGVFEYRVEHSGIVLVKLMRGPFEHEWTAVEYGFELEQPGQDLVLWLESENPLPADFVDYWPFWGEFVRGAEGV